jgi:hypothetical protein
MKTTNLASPVRLEWLLQQNARLDARPYVGGAFEARDLLKRLAVPTERLRDLAAGHEGGLYNGPRIRRIFVTEPQHGVPFLGGADMLEADLSHLPPLRRADAESTVLSYLRVEPGMTFISLESVREMRHKGMSVLVASQDPPSVPVSLIELADHIIVHKFTSPAWLKHLQKANAALSTVTAERLAELRPGEAYLWASKSTDTAFTERMVKIRTAPG